MILSGVIRRFPVPLACAALGIAAYGVSELGLFDVFFHAKLIRPIIVGFFASIPFHVLAEARKWDSRKGILFAALAAGYAAAHVLVVSAIGAGGTGVTLVCFLLASTIMMLTVPYLADVADYDGAARYARGVLIFLALGLAAAMLIALAPPLAAHLLLGVNIGTLLPLDVALSGFAISLVLFPRTPRRAGDQDTPRSKPPRFLSGLADLVALLVLPLLYWQAFLGVTGPDSTRLSDQSLPFISAFAVICHLAGSGPAARESIVRRTWHRYYRAAAALPVAWVLPKLSIEATNYVDLLGLLAAAWVIAAGIFATLSARHTVAVPMTILAAMLAVAGTAPAGMEDLLNRRRLAAVERILARNDILTDGRISPARHDLPHSDGEQLYDLVETLTRPSAGNGLAAFLAAHGVEFEDGALHTGCPYVRPGDAVPAEPCSAREHANVVRDVLASLGLRRQRYFEQTRVDLRAGIEYRTEVPSRIDVDGFDRLHRRAAIAWSYGRANVRIAPESSVDLTIGDDGLSLIVTTGDGRSAKLDFAALVEYLHRDAGRVDDKEFRRLAVLDGSGDRLKLRAYPYDIGIEPRGDHWGLRSAAFVLLVGEQR